MWLSRLRDLFAPTDEYDECIAEVIAERDALRSMLSRALDERDAFDVELRAAEAELRRHRGHAVMRAERSN
jgi:hypothetical protein